MKRLVLFIPLLVFLVIGVFLWRGLALNPSELPSALVGKAFPEFTLGTVKDAERTVTRDVLLGEVSLVNVWATWCVACRVEHPELLRLAKEEGIKIYGVNYKDDRNAALKWLDQYADPYQFSIYDPNGALGLDLGVYGAPETFVVDAQGIIRHRYAGVVDAEVWQQTLRPVVEQWRQ